MTDVSEAGFYVLPNSKTGILYVPSSIVTADGFPIQNEEKVTIYIEGEKLVVSKKD